MILRISFKVRSFTYLLSAMAHMFFDNPAGLLDKIGERARQSGMNNLGALLRVVSHGKHQTEFEQRIIVGDLSGALELPRTRASQKRRLREQQSLLESEPSVSRNAGLVSDKRVLAYLTNSYPHTLSGYTVRSGKVLESLSKAGCGVLGVTRLGYPLTIGKFPRAEIEEAEGVRYARLVPILHKKSSLARMEDEVNLLVQLAKRCRANLLYTTTDFRNALVVSKAAEELRIPWIYEVRGEPEKTWLSRVPSNNREEASKSEYFTKRRALETKAMLASTAVIALSEVSKTQLIGRGIPISKIWVVPNCVDADLLHAKIDKSEARAKLNLPNRVWVGAITSVVEYEGLDTLIEALHHLPDHIHLLIVGDGVHLPNLRRQAQDLGLEGRVSFVGRKPREEIALWYSALDLFVLPRKNYEVCRTVTPIKAMEAMALGVPLVASDLPAVREVTGDCAKYFPAEDPQRLAEVIASALNDESLAEKGKSWAATRTWDHAAKVYGDLLGSLTA